MSHRKILGILLVISSVLFFTGFTILFPEKVGICSDDCFHDITFSLGEPLFIGMMPVILSLILLVFNSRNIFDSWKYFALIYIVFSAIIIKITPVICSSMICFDKEAVTFITGLGFLFTTIGIIIYKTIQVKFQNR